VHPLGDAARDEDGTALVLPLRGTLPDPLRPEKGRGSTLPQWRFLEYAWNILHEQSI